MSKEYNPEDTVIFINITNQDFICKYDGRKYLIKGSEKLPFRLPVAQHFAKHLADQILQKEYDEESKKNKDLLKKNRARLWMDPKRPELYAQMIPELAEELGELVHSAQELVAKLDEKEGLQDQKESR